ncbi:MAG: hypothetical protein KKA31_04245 [Candidatus Margulisbacteria bacterium]|nr:hypothetical protein [Candidatus Margulisiibacteriota bacterium]
MTNADSPAVKPNIALWTKYLTQYKSVKKDLVQKIIEALKKGEVVYVKDGKIVDATTPGVTKIDLRDGLSQKEAKALGLTAKQADQIAAQGWALKGETGVQTDDSAKVLDVSELARFDAAIQEFADANGWSFDEALQAYYANNAKFQRTDTKARKENRVKTEAELLKGLKKVTNADQFTAYLKETLKLQDDNPILANLKAFDFSKAADRQKAIAYIIKLASGSEWSKDFQEKILKFAKAIQTPYKGQLDLASIKAWAPEAKAYGEEEPAVVVETGEPEKADNAGVLNNPTKVTPPLAEPPPPDSKPVEGTQAEQPLVKVVTPPLAPPAEQPPKASSPTAVIAPVTPKPVNVAAKKADEKKAAKLAKQAAAAAADTRKQEAKQPIETANGLIGKLEKADDDQIKAAITKVESSYGKKAEFETALKELNDLIEAKKAAIIEEEQAAKALAVEQEKAQALTTAIEGRKLNAKPVIEKAGVLQKKYEARGSKKSVEIAGQIKAAIALVEGSITTGKRFKKYLKALQTFVEKKEAALNEAVKQDAKKAHGLRKKALESLKKEFEYSDLMKKLEAKMPKTEAQTETINKKLGEVKVALLSGVDFKVKLGELKAALEAGQAKLDAIKQEEAAAEPNLEPKPEPAVVKRGVPKLEPKEVFSQVWEKLEKATSIADIEAALTILRTIPEKDISFYANVTEAMKKAETAIALIKKYSTSTNEYVRAAAVELQKQALECLMSACTYPSSVAGGSDAEKLDSYLKQIEIIAKIESQNLSPAKAYDAYKKQMPSSYLLDVYIDKILPKLSQVVKEGQAAQAAQLKKQEAQKKIDEHKAALPKLLKKLEATGDQKLIAFGTNLQKTLAKTNSENLSNYEKLLKETEANLNNWVQIAQKKMPIQYAIYRLKTNDNGKILSRANLIVGYIKDWMKVFDNVGLSGSLQLKIKIKNERIENLSCKLNGFKVCERTEATQDMPKAVDQKIAMKFLEALFAKVQIKGLKNGTYKLPLTLNVNM